MPKVFINKDAQELYDLSQRTVFTPDDFARLSALAIIAERLERLDQKALGSYALGFADGRNSVLYARSNLADSRGTYRNLEEALAAFKGEVQVIKPAAKKTMQDTMTMDDLDLEF